MPTYFTVDRLGTLSEGAVVETTHSGTGTDLIPEYVSRHGARYLTVDVWSHWCPQQGNGRDMMIELVWELARRQVNPQAPSRLECLFAWATIDQARAFRGASGGTIYEVEAERGFKADMAHLGVDGTLVDIAARTSAYWKQLPGPRVQWEHLLTLPVTIGPSTT
ncbi:hypothetical protein SEA_JUJU_39 [Gordonia phage JuJu]|uniref:Uncharacterized protein n=1 Tax=Gordonia phage JuJu TaxID=2590929 RepID=A0A516KR81_9CAUD|nr:hypothetical protein KNU69_gp39 [Gordonia phage JuJu]QDP44155.1 hypothetical protein SEA_JUJU_39 [Gordonia phage JuJu]